MPRKTASMEDAFLQTILDSPDDDAPRLVFADWLEEQGNPRGEFIRLQCQRAKLTKYDPEWPGLLARESALLKQFEKDWSKPVLRYVEEAQYRRGFIEHVRASASKLLKSGGRLFQAAPIRSIRLTHADRLADLAQCGWLSRVRDLDLSDAFLGSTSLHVLLESPHCRSLHALCLSRCGLHSAAGKVLAGASFDRLNFLDLSWSDLDAGALHTLAHATSLQHLREFRLHGDRITAEGAVALADKPVFRLSSLSLGTNRLGNDGVAAIAACAQFADLRRLDLDSNEIGNLGVEAIVQSPHMRNLERLALYDNNITARGVQLLSESPLLANLTHLNLKTNEIDKPTLQTIPQRLQTPKMRELLF
jgi:uncharacterized protein (TIGR02996 family)